MPQQPAPTFAVISGAQVHRALNGREQVGPLDLVERTYLAHGSGNTVNRRRTSCGSRTDPRRGSSRCPRRWVAHPRWLA